MSLKVIGTDTYRCATYDFLLTFHSNHWPISHRFRDRLDGDFSRKSPIFPLFFPNFAPAEWVPLGIGYRRMGSKTRVMGLLGRTRSKTASLAVWIQSTNVMDGRTDGHRATAKNALRPTHSDAR